MSKWGNRDEWAKHLKLTEAKKKRAKYGNVKTTGIDGRVYDSGLEHDRGGQLQLLQRAGEIRDLDFQVRIKITIAGVPILYASGRHLSYIADFTYFDIRLNKPVIEDAKGYKTEVYRIKKALLAAMGYHIVEVTK